MPGVVRRLLVVAGLLVAAQDARAYEYEVTARTLTQAFELRSFRLSGGDVVLGRRRFTQGLTLEIRDIGDLEAKRRRVTRFRKGPRISLSSYLRLDHDFGDWTMGEATRDDRAVDAIDAIPELASSSLALDLLYAYVTVEDLAGGLLDLRVGRQVRMDLLDAWAFDGATATVHTPWHAAVEVAGGLRVRDASPFGVASYELDGTTGADCREYVEAATPGAGSWRIIDRSRVPAESRFTADLDFCPQRRELMPTVGVAVATEGLRAIHARLSYRRSMSATPGVIDGVDRLDYPDVGLYPNESGQAPGWGVNEERVAMVVSGAVERRGGRVRITPWAGARWSLVHALVDEAVVGARVRLGDHALEPEVARSVPTFDADSIFSVFAVEPSSDVRLDYHWAPRDRGLAARAGAWVRRYDLGGDGEYAGGGTAGGEWRARDLAVRLDALVDAGWGGRRAGATAALRWRRRDARYDVRASLLDVAEEADRDAPDRRLGALHGTLAVGGTWVIADGVGFHALTEATTSRWTPLQARVLGVLDLAWAPDL